MLRKTLLKTTMATLSVACLIGQANAATEIKISFNQTDTNPQYLGLVDFGKRFEAATDGRYKVNVFANELLGDQRTSLELVQNGAIQMAMVANPLVENYDANFRILGVPYTYKNLDHQEKVYTSDIFDDLFKETDKYGFKVLTVYTAGARSMYTKNAPIKTQADMKGKKTRVMQSDTMTKMLGCLGGVGVPMSQGEVYTAIQQGILDGAENNEIAYADLKQYEVAPYFSTTQHMMAADLLVVNSDFYNSLSDEDKVAMEKAAKESTKAEFGFWREAMDKAIETAKKGGATFTQVDTKPFEESCKPLQESLVNTPELKKIYEKIQSLR